MAARVSIKQMLRKSITATVASMSDTQRALESLVIQQQVLAHEWYRSSHAVCAFLSYPGEISTQLIIEDLLRQDSNKLCFIPVIMPDDQIRMVRVHSMADLATFVPNRWRIPEPTNALEREEALDHKLVDLVIVPGVAFSADGSRIGHGKGYYDRYLRRMFAAYNEASLPLPRTLAIGYSTQLVPNGSVPMNERDQKVDLVLTPPPTPTTPTPSE